MSSSIQNPILLINKSPGPTSHDIVDRVRRQTGEKRVGHAGTLDPFAEGLLIVLVGREATKRQAEFLGMDKDYEAVIHLGTTSTTEDVTGEIVQLETVRLPARNDVEKVVYSFVGPYDQMPPAYSAKKIKGKKAYELAREGKKPELQPKRIMIHSIEILDYRWPLLTLRCTVSSGTYIRALARDIGEKLCVGAYVEKLKRTAIGPYSLDGAQRVDDIPCFS